MRIGVDIDDVLGDLNQALNRYLFDTRGITLKREDWIRPGLHEITNIERDEAIKTMVEFNNSDYLKGLVPIQGSIAAINELKDYYELILVTARHEEIDTVTREFIDEHFAGAFRGLHYTKAARHDGSKINKSEICRREDIKVFIDDGAHHAEDCVNAGIRVFLFDTPWNQECIAHPLISRVFSWQEIVSALAA